MESKQKARKLYHEGTWLDSQGKYQEAIDRYDESLKLNPDNNDVRFEKAETLTRLKNCDEAIKCYDEAQRRGFNNVTLKELWFRKGVCLGNSGRHKEAIECYDNALAIDENYYNSLNYKGVALYRSRKYKESLDCFDKAISVDGHEASAYKNKGNVLSLLKKYSEAIEYYNAAIDRDENYAAAWTNKGNALYGISLEGKEESYEEAIECYDRALEISGHNNSYAELVATSYLNRGQSKYILDKVTDAMEDFKQVNFVGLNARKYNNMGLCYYQLGLYDDAERDFLNAIKTDPKLVNAYYNLAVLYNSEGKLDRSKRLLNSCLMIDRNFQKARDALKKLDSSGQTDWYDWWFGSIKQKKVLGVLLVVIILSLIMFTALFAFIDLKIGNLRVKDISTINLTAVTIMTGFLVAILLLPSLKKIKFGNVELETAPIMAKLYLELEVSLPMTGRRV